MNKTKASAILVCMIWIALIVFFNIYLRIHFLDWHELAHLEVYNKFNCTGEIVRDTMFSAHTVGSGCSLTNDYLNLARANSEIFGYNLHFLLTPLATITATLLVIPLFILLLLLRESPGVRVKEIDTGE